MSNWAKHASGPLANQNASFARLLKRGFATSTKNETPETETNTTTNASTTAATFTHTPADYLPFDKEMSTYVLNAYTRGKIDMDSEIKDYIGADMLGLNDPVFREEIESVENVAKKADKEKMETFYKIAESDEDPAKKIRELIKLGAPSDIVFNTMYNVLPRIAPGRKDTPNLDRLDWKSNSHIRRIDEVDMNGYDVEDSSDPDTLPRQRPFTVDEMNRILQDVEESNTIESEMEELLFQPIDIIRDLRNQADRMEIRNEWRKFVSVAPRDANLHKMSLEDFLNYRPPKIEKDDNAVEKNTEDPETIRLKETLQGLAESMNDKQGVKLPPNKLGDMVAEHATEWMANRNAVLGEAAPIGYNSGAIPLDEVVKHQFFSNPGAGLIPEAIDFAKLPFERENVGADMDSIHDKFLDIQYPFALRIDDVVVNYLKQLEENNLVEASEHESTEGEANYVDHDADVENAENVDEAVDEEGMSDETLPPLKFKAKKFTSIHKISNFNIDSDPFSNLKIREDFATDNPELGLAIRRFLAGTFDNRFPKFMAAKTKAEQYAIVEPLFKLWKMLSDEMKCVPPKLGQYVDRFGNPTDTPTDTKYDVQANAIQEAFDMDLVPFELDDPELAKFDQAGLEKSDISYNPSRNVIERNEFDPECSDSEVTNALKTMAKPFSSLIPEPAAQTMKNLQDNLVSHPVILKDTYARLMKLYDNDDEVNEAVKLRAQLSLGLYDPDQAYRNTPDPYWEDFTVDNTVVMDADKPKPLAEFITKGDPFRNYYDKLPEGIKRFEYTVDVNLDYEQFVKNNDAKKANDRRFLLKQNNVQYNHIISKRKLKQLRKGLDKYSGVPPHLLDFLEVFHNRRRDDLVASNPDEIKLREKITLERLAQPSTNLSSLDGRPEDSAFEAPDISTPIVLDAPTTHGGVRKIQSNYKKFVADDPVAKRLLKYKAALVTSKSDNTINFEEDSDASRADWITHDNSEMELEFMRIRDKIIAEAHAKDATDYEEFRPAVVDTYPLGLRALSKKVATFSPKQRIEFLNNGTLPKEITEINDDHIASLVAGRTGSSNDLEVLRNEIIEYLRSTQFAQAEGLSPSDRKKLLAEFQLEGIDEIDPVMINDAIGESDVEGSMSQLEAAVAAGSDAEIDIKFDAGEESVAEEPVVAEVDQDEEVELDEDGNPIDIPDSEPTSFVAGATDDLDAQFDAEADALVDRYDELRKENTYLLPKINILDDAEKGMGLSINLDKLSSESLSGTEINVAAVLLREREMIREVARKLQINKKSDRAALRRIYSISPEYARELVQRAANISNGLYPEDQLVSDVSGLTPIAGVNWQKELHNLEERMAAQAVSFNAKTGGYFPGVPAVNRHDAGSYNVPDLIAGEFAPLFVDSNLISSSDEFVDESYRLPGFANATFPLVSTTNFNELRKDNSVETKDFNDVPLVDEEGVENAKIYKANQDDRVDAIRAFMGDAKLYEVTELPADVQQWFAANNNVRGREFLDHYRHALLQAIHGKNDDAVEFTLPEPTSYAEELLVAESEYSRVTRYCVALIEFFNKPTVAAREALDHAAKFIPIPKSVAPESTLFRELYRSLYRNQRTYLLSADGNLIYTVGDLQGTIAELKKGAVFVDAKGQLEEGLKKYDELKSTGVEFITAQTSGGDDIILRGYYNKETGFIPTEYEFSSTSFVGAAKDIADQVIEGSFDHGRVFDPVVLGPSGYPSPPPNYRQIIDRIGSQTKIMDDNPYDTYVRFSDDPKWNFIDYMSTVDGKKKTFFNNKGMEHFMFNNLYDGQPKRGSIGSDITYQRSTVQALDRPEEDDLTRRLVDPTVTLSDVMSVREYKALQTIYDLRMAKNFFENRLSPGEAAFMRNKFRLMDDAYQLDTMSDQESDLARIQKEVVVGVVREWIEDHDINSYTQEFDAHNVEPDYDPFHQHDDLLNAFAARRISPYSTLPLGESNIPPIIGLETQKHVYTLHLLDPATFHPRWIARRLNMTYSAAIGMLKIQDMYHKRWTQDGARHDHHIDNENDIDDEAYFEEGGEHQLNNVMATAGEAHVDFDSDISIPHPIEVTLSPSDPEALYARFAPSLIGRITWTKRKEADVGDLAWRHRQGPAISIFGDQGMYDMYHYEQKMNQRWASKERILDALEKAAFSRWGAIQWGGTNLKLQRAPKLPREIISTTLHPPTRHNWMLTTLDEAKESIYAICVRDRDGYLRHPTYNEFQKVRRREKDRRKPFYWRKHHVLGRIPDVSNLFVDQVYAIKKQIANDCNPAPEHRPSIAEVGLSLLTRDVPTYPGDSRISQINGVDISEY